MRQFSRISQNLNHPLLFSIFIYRKEGRDIFQIASKRKIFRGIRRKSVK
jgi:hypothetical protein